MTVNKYFDDVFCINLKHRTDRWNKVYERFRRENINVIKWDGIDGNTQQIIEMFNNEKKNNPYCKLERCNEYAILLTYIDLFKNILKEKYKKVLIFEDDVLFIQQFDMFFNRSIQHLPKDFMMWSLGVSQYGFKNLNYTKDMMFFKPTPPNETYGNFAFGIKSEYISMILPIIENYTLAADNYIYRHKIDGESKVYISCPPLCSHENGYSDNYNRQRDSTYALDYCPCNNIIKYRYY